MFWSLLAKKNKINNIINGTTTTTATYTMQCNTKQMSQKHNCSLLIDTLLNTPDVMNVD